VALHSTDKTLLFDKNTLHSPLSFKTNVASKLLTWREAKILRESVAIERTLKGEKHVSKREINYPQKGRKYIMRNA